MIVILLICQMYFSRPNTCTKLVVSSKRNKNVVKPIYPNVLDNLFIDKFAREKSNYLCFYVLNTV